MALPSTQAPAPTAGRRLVRRGLALVLVVALLVGVAYALGYRINLQTRSIPVPTARTTPEEVVLAYASAYNHRDFDTMAAIYPSAQDRVSRFRAMGLMNDVRIIRSRSADESDLDGAVPEPGSSHYLVEVTLSYSGLTGSDLAQENGPGGCTYRLERLDPTRPWSIIDDGNG